MASFITDEIKSKKNDLAKQERERIEEIRKAEIKDFLEAIKDVCEDTKRAVISEYSHKGTLPSSVRVICEEVTTTVANSKRCSKALLSALKKLEEHTSSVKLEAFEPTIYNQYGRSYVVVSFSWE